MNSSSSISNDEVSIPISRQGTLLQGEDAVERSSSWFIPKLIRGSESSSKTTASSISVTKRKNGSIKGSIKFSAHNFITQSYDCFTDHYEILGLLGDGGYGEVFRCKHKESGAERAVKVIEMTSEEQGETILAEFQVLRGLDHPNLLKVFQLFEAEEEGIFYIVTDLYEGGELYSEIEQCGAFVEEDAAIIMNQVLSAVFYCHSQGVCHRDIKPENILLADKSMQLDDLKLIDFGLAALFDDYEHERFMDKVGSSYYMAPEILGPDGHGPKADIWSCGVVCYILLCGGAPFDGDDGEQIMDAIAFGEFTFADDPIWEEVSEEAKDFIAYLLTYDENERPTAEQALKHPWLENVRSTSSQGFVERESIAAIKSLGYLENFRADCKLKQAVCAFIASQILTRREKDMIDSLFRTLDTNCDGKLSREELRLGFEIFQGKDLAEDDLDDIFRRVNFCGSGVIEYSEFVVASMQDLFDETKLRAAFNIFDKEGKGYLTSDCIKEVIAVPGNDEMTERALEQIMSQVRNSKGRISFEDFEEAMLGASTSSATDTDTDDSDKNQHDSQNLRSSLTTTTRRSLQRTSHILFWEDDSFGSCCTSSTVIKPPVFSESQSLGPADIARKTIKLTEPRIKATRSLVAHTHSLSYARIYAVGRGS